MEYSSRGKIQNRERARQIIDFSGIRYGNITPTDIDGMVEYRDKAFLLFEYKFSDNDLPYGQELAFTRLTDCIQKAGKHATFLVCEHMAEDCSLDVDAANAVVRKIYYAGQWYTDGKRTAKQVTDAFISFVDMKAPF